MKSSVLVCLLFSFLSTFSYAHGVKSPRRSSISHEELDNCTKSQLSQAPSLFYQDGQLNLELLEAELDKCAIVRKLNHELEHHHHHHHEDEPSFIEGIFERLFPFNAAWNSVLATAYISGPPNLILSLIPASIDPSKLTMLVSFAVGGLLGDVFLHLLPQTFLGEPAEEKAHFVLVDEKRNIVLGVFIFIGFAFFFSIDKGLRILNHDGEETEGHSHGHSHSHDTGKSSNIETKESNEGLKQRKITNKEKEKEEPVVKEISSSVRTAAWLNLISDFTHNITDGLAITSAFYISRSVGSTTALAIFLHEVPHEIGDFAVLIQGGFTKWQAMNSQFVTAVGAFVGCLIGIGIQNLANKASVSAVVADDLVGNGLFGTTVSIADLTLPFTAGGFLYIATVGVIPEVLELEGKTTRCEEFKKALGQMAFILLGIGMMFGISWFE